MTDNITFAIIKPNTVAAKQTGAILNRICEAGFSVSALRMVRLSREQASCFYAIHAGKPFYEGLVAFMASGPVVVMVLEKENAVESFRKLIGTTDPARAEPGTIRALFGETVQRNAVHGSDSDENARKEADFFFPHFERFDCCGGFQE